MAYPNNEGNYTGKRTPKPAPKPKSATERFHDLVAMYETRARDYRWKRNRK